jgi:hypothetical protein
MHTDDNNNTSLEKKVLLNVYDLSRGVAEKCSHSLFGIKLDGLWHTSITVYGHQIYYGDGIQDCTSSAETLFGKPTECIECGYTQLTLDQVNTIISELATTEFAIDTYKLVEHNCNHFCNRLLGILFPPQARNDIIVYCVPDRIISQAQLIADIPLCKRARPLIERSKQPLQELVHIIHTLAKVYESEGDKTTCEKLSVIEKFWLSASVARSLL